MGYTHYWSNKGAMSDSEWEAITDAARQIIGRARSAYFITLAFESDEPTRKPVVSKTAIRFNGIGDDGHETFCIGPDGTEFEFCKTAQKDYDPVVVAILIAAAHYAEGFSWRSDGWLADHADGLQLFTETCGVDLKWSNADVDDNDPDRAKVTNVVSLDHARDKAS